MNPFDINIHLPCQSEVLSGRMDEDLAMDGKALRVCFDHNIERIQRWCSGGNFMLFNQDLDPEDASKFIGYARSIIPNARFTHLARLQSAGAHSRLKELREAGIDGIKFHSYLQEIDDGDFEVAVTLATEAAKLGMPTFIDASYGSTRMYAYDNLRLAAAVIDHVVDAPIVLLHSGGARAIEAMLLAEVAPNVFLDSSFSVPYYLGSTIEADLAFAYQKVGSDRVVYGSDSPYVSFEESLSKTEEFLGRNGFADWDWDMVFGGTAERLFGWKAS